MLISRACLAAICTLLFSAGNTAVSFAGDDLSGIYMSYDAASNPAPSPSQPQTTKASQAQAAEATSQNFIEELFSGVFGSNLAGTAESACLGYSFSDIRDFKETAAFKRLQIAALQRATVRISFQSQENIEVIAKRRFAGVRYDLRELPLVGSNGTCTGTMIARNLVLTAGHCVDARYYETEHKDKVKMPRVYDRRRKSSQLEHSELGLFLQADFNYQLPYRTADNDVTSSIDSREEFSTPVIEVVSSKYKPYNLDYAILKLSPENLKPSSFSIGLSKMELTARPRRTQPLAIIQHPSGNTKKIGTGTVHASNSSRVFYSDLSTEGGSSGAGILNRNGKLVGIHTRGRCGNGNSDVGWDPDGVPNSNHGMRISVISEILKDALKESP